MSDYFWCHGPLCHTYTTQDRVRGSKGSKVLRTRKIKQDKYQKSMFGHGGGNIWDYFCSHNCHMDFAHKHAERIIAIEPRIVPLETKIEDPVREKHTHNYSFGEHSYYTTTIKKLDTSNDVG